MAVDPKWLENVRRKNREAFGMSGLGDMGVVSSRGLVEAARQERELRRESIHRGRFEERDPLRPAEGSVESIARAIGFDETPAPAPQPTVSRGVVYLFGAVVLGLGGYVVYKLATRSS